MKFLTFFFLLISALSHPAFGDVWKSERDWVTEDETKFSAWIATDHFNKRIFIDSASPYKNLTTDCADVIYAARIIFAFVNKLHFKSFNPTKQDGNFWKKFHTQKQIWTNQFVFKTLLNLKKNCGSNVVYEVSGERISNYQLQNVTSQNVELCK